MTLPERLERKWCTGCIEEGTGDEIVGGPLPHTHEDIVAAVREALEEARSVITGHIEVLRLFRFERSAYIPAIVRELEIVSQKLKVLKGATRDA